MTQKDKEIVKEMADLFLDKTICKIANKFENEDEKGGAWLLLTYQFIQAYPLLKKLKL